MPPIRLATATTLLALPALLPAQVTEDTPGCSRLDIPARIAAIGDLLDVPRLSRGLAQAGIGVEPVHSLVTVRFDERGGVQHVGVLASSVDSVTDRAVRDALAGALVPQPPADPWGIRVLLVLGDQPSIQFERAERCPPVLLERPSPRIVSERVITVPADQLHDMAEEPNSPVRLRVLIDERGRVARSTVIRSTGERSLDQAAISHWRNARFRPGTLDGIPIPMWYEPDDLVRDP